MYVWCLFCEAGVGTLGGEVVHVWVNERNDGHNGERPLDVCLLVYFGHSYTTFFSRDT